MDVIGVHVMLKESNKERMGDALALGGEERRGKLR